MSTKTLRKRIALVAVSAMGFGLLTSVSAHATAGDLAVAANGTSTSAASRGIVSINGSASTTSLSASTGTTNYMSVLSTGWVYVTLGSGSSNSGMSVSGGVIAATSNTGSADTLNATSTVVTRSDTTTISAIIKPSSGSTQTVVTGYSSSALTTSVGVLTINWVSPTTSGVFSASTSLFSVETTTNAAADNVDATWTPTGGTAAATSATIRTNSQSGYYGYYAKDANGSDLTAPAVSASSTGGCLLKANANSAGTMSTAYDNSAASGYFRIDKPTANVPATCVVTISVNGVVASTRTFTFHGDVVKIKVDYVKAIEAKSTSSAAAIYASAYDSAGNSLDNITLAPASAYYNANLTTIGNITTAPFGTAATDGSASITCTGTSVNKMKLATTSATAATVTSDEFTITCSGDPVNYTAKLDKASYAPGDIAVLTITAKDSTGALTHSDATMGDSTYPVSIAGSNLTAVSAITDADKFTAGVKTYKFIVGSTEGSYQLAVDLPLYNSSTYAQSAQTVAYSIKSATSAVSNAEVLAAIVKLIASINKQIAALQKALTKKK